MDAACISTPVRPSPRLGDLLVDLLEIENVPSLAFGPFSGL